jgi:hypothetical protein
VVTPTDEVLADIRAYLAAKRGEAYFHALQMRARSIGGRTERGQASSPRRDTATAPVARLPATSWSV